MSDAHLKTLTEDEVEDIATELKLICGIMDLPAKEINKTLLSGRLMILNGRVEGADVPAELFAAFPAELRTVAFQITLGGMLQAVSEF